MKTLTSNVIKIKTDNGFVEVPSIAGTTTNDNIVSEDTTWSSQKISQLNNTKVDKTLAIMVDENGRTYIDDEEDDV